jgi:hypothetical protein
LLGKYSATWTAPTTLFALVNFWIGSCIFAQASLNCNPSIQASHTAVITGMWHHAQFIGWDEVLITFCLGLPQTVILLVSISQVTGLIRYGQPCPAHCNNIFFCKVVAEFCCEWETVSEWKQESTLPKEGGVRLWARWLKSSTCSSRALDSDPYLGPVVVIVDCLCVYWLC